MIEREIQNFDLQQTADSGQCFRMNRLTDGEGAYHADAGSNCAGASCPGADVRYSVISAGRYLEISQKGSLFTFNCPDEDFPFWRRYFDLETDYSRFIASIRKRDVYLQKAAEAGNGIRILNQDPWEMILTFILSQQKTIPKIREAVEALCSHYGTPIPTEQAGGRVVYSFPDARALCAASIEDLKSLKLGYRAKYIRQICLDCAGGELDLDRLISLNYQDAMEYLTGFYGIGTKVANCICLFGLHLVEAFPVDTWIEQILKTHYYKKKYDEIPKNRLYETIIKENFGGYKGYAGIMQQYIFYYERLCKNKVKPPASETA